MNYNCCDKNNLPNNAKYFKEDILTQVINITNEYPDIDTIIDFLVESKIENYKIVNVQEGVSNEGNVVTGRKIIVEVGLKEKLIYSAVDCRQGVKIFTGKSFKSFSIIIPKKLKNESIEELMRKGRVSIVPYINDIIYRKLDERSFHKVILIFVDVRFC